MLGILPGYWTWENVISRHQGLLKNVTDELNYSRIVTLIGAEKTQFLYQFHPFEPDLQLDPTIPEALLFKDILAPYEAFRKKVVFSPEDIKPAYRNEATSYKALSTIREKEISELVYWDQFALGSNNWVVSGKLTESGCPY